MHYKLQLPKAVISYSNGITTNTEGIIPLYSLPHWHSRILPRTYMVVL